MGDLAIARAYKIDAANGTFSSKDTGTCVDCKQSQETLRDTLAEVDKLRGQLEALKVDDVFNKKRFNELKQRSDNITKSMATKLDEHGDLENLNDEFANTNLGKKFEDLYNTKWADMMDWLCENVNTMTELSRIEAVSDLLQKAYVECVQVADNQIRQFLFLGNDEAIPDFKNKPTLYKERMVQGQDKTLRQQIQQKIISTVVTEKSIKAFCSDKDDDDGKLDSIRKKIEDFLCDYVDLCWLFTISLPKLYLEFDVINQQFSELKDRFRSFSCEEEVKDMSKVKDTVYCIVWPCVSYINHSGIVVKGDVIVVDEGREVSTTCCI